MSAIATARKISQIERTFQPLYDQIEISAGQRSFKFFQIPQIEKESGFFTNLKESGKLLNKTSFEVHILRIIPEYDADPKSIAEIADHSWFRLWVGQTELLTINSYSLMDAKTLANAEKCCAECKAVSTNTVSISCGRPDVRGLYVLAEPINLIANQNFCAEIVFTENPKLISPLKVGVYLDGYWKKELDGFNIST